jgi:3-oxoacyl-[acyl-carrier protein] reductase
MRLKGKVAIVTGASAGIGRATAYAIAMEGAYVVITYHMNKEGAEKVAQDIIMAGGKILTLNVDISKQDDVQQMVQRTIDEFGRVDILVNNAAFLEQQPKPFQETSLAEWKAEIDTTFIGTLLCTKTVLPHMIKQKSGRIINIGSNAGKSPITPNISIYSACKAAVAVFTKAIARDLATTGITVNCVSPGAIRTEKLSKYWTQYPEAEKALVDAIPMHRIGNPEDIAKMIVFLASNDANFITGQDYSVDGGRTA